MKHTGGFYRTEVMGEGSEFHMPRTFEEKVLGCNNIRGRKTIGVLQLRYDRYKDTCQKLMHWGVNFFDQLKEQSVLSLQAMGLSKNVIREIEDILRARDPDFSRFPLQKD